MSQPDPRPAQFAPPSIRQRADELSAALRCPAEVTTLYGGRWRITLANDRVRVTVDYRLRQRARLDLTASTLEVDGQPRPLARDLDHLAAIFADPDTARDPETSAVAPMPPGDLTDAPPLVRQIHDTVAESVAGSGLAVVTARVDGAWTVGIDSDRATLRVRFTTVLPRRGEPYYMPDVIRLWIDGRDLTEEVDGHLDRALGLIAPTFPDTTPASAGPPPPRRGPSPAPNQTLETRRHTIIRT